MTRPFRPPEVPAEVRGQLQRLHRGLQAVGSIDQLGVQATATDVARKVNEIIVTLAALTREGDTGPARPTTITE